MTWQDDVSRDLNLWWDNLMGPGSIYRLERHFWLELWRAPVVEAIEENGIETRLYGPIQATVVATLRRTPLLNLVLGAADPGAVRGGHLAEALDWIESLGVECRIPIRPDYQESGAAEDLLNQRGYRRTSALARFVRDNSPPDFPEPPGIEVDEWAEETEGFSDYFEEGYGLVYPAGSFFDSLPGHRDWRCYVSIDRDDEGTGAAVMMQHYEVAQFGFAAAKEASRHQGSHLALLRRRIVDATAAGSRLLFADTEEAVDYPSRSSTAARNLGRAGFKLASVRPVWQPPAAAEPELEEEPDEDDGDDLGIGRED